MPLTKQEVGCNRNQDTQGSLRTARFKSYSYKRPLDSRLILLFTSSQQLAGIRENKVKAKDLNKRQNEGRPTFAQWQNNINRPFQSMI
uniref:Uncharacterized protein n=1 Tax=Anguilla anguilla TaxID=7936 RepID=A0A0E9V3R1_ANGAN